MRVAVFKAMSLMSTGRTNEGAYQSQADAAILIGTRLRAPLDGVTHWVQRGLPNRCCATQFDRERGELTNKVAGVSYLFEGAVFKEKYVREVAETEARTRDRMAAIRFC